MSNYFERKFDRMERTLGGLKAMLGGFGICQRIRKDMGLGILNLKLGCENELRLIIFVSTCTKINVQRTYLGAANPLQY